MNLIQNVIGIGQLILNLFGALGDFLLFDCSTFLSLEGWQYGFQTMWGYLDLSMNSGTLIYSIVHTALGSAYSVLNAMGLSNVPIGVVLIVLSFLVVIAVCFIGGIVRAIIPE